MYCHWYLLITRETPLAHIFHFPKWWKLDNENDAMRRPKLSSSLIGHTKFWSLRKSRLILYSIAIRHRHAFEIKNWRQYRPSQNKAIDNGETNTACQSSKRCLLKADIRFCAWQSLFFFTIRDVLSLSFYVLRLLFMGNDSGWLLARVRAIPLPPFIISWTRKAAHYHNLLNQDSMSIITGAGERQIPFMSMFDGDVSPVFFGSRYT